EMGTTTYYQALNTVCGEPVLRELTWHIRNDEVQHYKHFYHYFLPSCATSDRRTFTDRRSSQPCGAGLLNCVTAMPISPCATRRHGASGAHSSSAGFRGHEAGLCTHGDAVSSRAGRAHGAQTIDWSGCPTRAHVYSESASTPSRARWSTFSIFAPV
ncbi:MAG: hypothetical protein ACYCUK_22160, partial [Thiomonas sp.]